MNDKPSMPTGHIAQLDKLSNAFGSVITSVNKISSNHPS